MKKTNKIIALLLALVCFFTISIPAVIAANTDESTTSEHADFSEVLSFITDEDGEVDWKTLPGTWLKIFAKIRIFEVIWKFFQAIFGSFNIGG